MLNKEGSPSRECLLVYSQTHTQRCVPGSPGLCPCSPQLYGLGAINSGPSSYQDLYHLLPKRMWPEPLPMGVTLFPD